MCAPGFRYSSGTNTEWLTVEQIRELDARACRPRLSHLAGMIPYGRQSISDADIAGRRRGAAVRLADAGSGGPGVRTGRRARVGAGHAVAVNSGTSALHIACLALGLGPGDLLWTVPNTFVASANCGRYCGADVDFVDIDPLTWNMSVASLKRSCPSQEGWSAAQGRRSRCISPGSRPSKRRSGSWRRSTASGCSRTPRTPSARHATASLSGAAGGRHQVFSFHPVKIITTGEGGMAITNDAELAERMCMLRSHGITRDPVSLQTPQEGLWYYEQQMLGFNYRMTDIQAALGTSQLERLTEFVERRNALARRYDRLLEGLPLRLPTVLPENRSAFHLYVVRLRRRSTGKTHGMSSTNCGGADSGSSCTTCPCTCSPTTASWASDRASTPRRRPTASRRSLCRCTRR